MNIWRTRGYLWVTLLFFILSLAGHWLFAWFAYVDEQQEHGPPVEVRGYLIEVSRDTLENWQSSCNCCGGLAFLLYIGLPLPKEGGARKE